MEVLWYLTIICLGLFTICDFYLIKTAQEKKRIWTKPFIIPGIAFLYLQLSDHYHIFLLGALLFSFLGDCFLLFSEKKCFFRLGLFSFLASHVWYICTFAENISWKMVAPFWALLLILPYLIYARNLLKSLSSYAGNYFFPIILYMITIMGMSYSSLLRFWSMRGFSFWLPFMGSLFFILSDTLLAIRNFRYGQRKGWISVMATYILAQCLIVFGMIEAG